MSGKTFFLQLNALQHLLNSIYQKTHEKHYFTVDNGLIYEMIYKDRVTRRNVYNMNLERINKHDTIKHYIQARGKYIRTSINEYSKDSQTIIPIEKKLKNYIVVYNFSDGNHYALQLEVYSRETGKCVLKLSSHIVPKNSQDPERIGVKYIEKDQIVQEVIYNEEKRTVTVNIYDLSSIPIKKKSYNLKFKSSGNLAVFYLDNEDGAYIRYIDDLYNSMVLYKLDGTSLNEIHLKKIPSNTLLPGEKERFFDNNILSYYNPDSNKTEYLMSAVKNTDEGIGLLKLFITDGFPLHMIKGSFDTLIVYKEYFLTVSKENKRKKAFIFHLYKGNRKLLSFKRKNINFKDAVMSKKGNYLYIAVVHNDGMEILKYMDQNSGELEFISSKSFNINNDSYIASIEKLIQDSMHRKNFRFSGDLASLYKQNWQSFTGKFDRINIIFPFITRASWVEGKATKYLPESNFTVSEYKDLDRDKRFFKVISDNAFIINNTLFVVDKEGNILHSREFYIYNNKIVLNILNSSRSYRTFYFDLDSKELHLIGYTENKRKSIKDIDDGILVPVNQKSVVYIFSNDSKEHKMRVYKLDLEQYDVKLQLVYVSKNAFLLRHVDIKFSSLFVKGSQVILYNTRVSNAEIYHVAYYMDGKKEYVFYSDEGINFRAVNDLNILTESTEQPVRKEEVER
jgi:hypothetical protein